MTGIEVIPQLLIIDVDNVLLQHFLNFFSHTCG